MNAGFLAKKWGVFFRRTSPSNAGLFAHPVQSSIRPSNGGFFCSSGLPDNPPLKKCWIFWRKSSALQMLNFLLNNPV
jgi:hypothetical protein